MISQTSQNIKKTTPGGARLFEVVDVQQLRSADPESAVKTFLLGKKPKIIYCDVFIAGGGTGGVAAALGAAREGATVCITEETDWLGGQMTSQGVSALDENNMVETTGANLSYQQLRTAIRNHYLQLNGISESAKSNAHLNPGNNWVSWLSFEPKIAVQKLEEILEQRKKTIHVYLRHKVVDLKLAQGRVSSALAVDLDSGRFVEFRPRYLVDATELGDMLPLADVPYASGAESRRETGEEHAPEQEHPENVQDFVYPFVIEFRPGEKHLIPKPANYERFKQHEKFSFMGYKMFENNGKNLPFWDYRRLVAKDNFPGAYPFDISMINWESNDLRGENIIDQQPRTMAERLGLAKDLSLGFLYWLQTEAARDDGGVGFPELFLRADILGSDDGLSKYPYIRESRRIKARRTIVEADIASATNSGARAKLFKDSVGIGLYPIDIHGHQDVPGAGQASKPFQIPLAALIQDKVRNLLPACKNIGTTHVTNGAYRLHPVEWAIGEAVGHLAAYCLRNGTTPGRVSSNLLKTRQLQLELLQHGIPLYWFDDVPTDHPQFVAIQFCTLIGVMPAPVDNLHFRPEDLITKREAADTIAGIHSSAAPHIKRLPAPELDHLHADGQLTCAELIDLAGHPALRSPVEELSDEKLTRARFAEWVYQLMSSARYLGRR
jgi:hypothetical protein